MTLSKYLRLRFSSTLLIIIFPTHRLYILLVFFTNSLALIETNMSEYFNKTYSLVSFQENVFVYQKLLQVLQNHAQTADL